MSVTAHQVSAASTDRGFGTAVLASVSWIALGLESIVRPAPETYRDLLWSVPWVLTAVSFWFIHQVQRSTNRRLESGAFWALMAASILAFAGNVGVMLNQPALAVLGFPLGAIIWATGLLLFGIATVRAGVFPRYVGIALVLLEPLAILTGLALSTIAPLQDHGGYSAGIEKGFVLALVGVGFLALRSEWRSTQSVQ